MAVILLAEAGVRVVDGQEEGAEAPDHAAAPEAAAGSSEDKGADSGAAPPPEGPDAGAPDRRMVKIERRRAAKQQAQGARRSQEGLPPVQQIALFKEDARERMQSRLTELLDGTRRAQDARKRARELLGKAFEQQPK